MFIIRTRLLVTAISCVLQILVVTGLQDLETSGEQHSIPVVVPERNSLRSDARHCDALAPAERVRRNDGDQDPVVFDEDEEVLTSTNADDGAAPRLKSLQSWQSELPLLDLFPLSRSKDGGLLRASGQMASSSNSQGLRASAGLVEAQDSSTAARSFLGGSALGEGGASEEGALRSSAGRSSTGRSSSSTGRLFVPTEFMQRMGSISEHV